MLRDADNYYSDIVVHCKDGVIKCHKNIICKRSDFFNNMMTVNMKERNTGKIKLPETKKEICYAILEYIYSGEIEVSKISVEVFIEADKMGLLKLKEDCAKQFIKARKYSFLTFIQLSTIVIQDDKF